MNCKRCNELLKENQSYCPKCGKSMYEEKSAAQNIVILPKKESKIKNIIINILAVIGGFTILMGIIVGIMFVVYYDIETKEQITIGDIKIPTIYSVIGQYEIIDFDLTSDLKYMTYNEKDINLRKMMSYINKLRKIGFKPMHENDGYISYIKEIKNNYVILINIYNDEEEIVITYEKIKSNEIKGEITQSDEFKTIGNDELGTIEIPKEWIEYFTQEEDELSFYDPTTTSHLFINKVKKDDYTLLEYVELLVNYENEEYEAVITTEEIMFKDQIAYKIIAYYEEEGYYSECLVFILENEIYAIEFQSRTEKDEIFNQFDTYEKN